MARHTGDLRQPKIGSAKEVVRGIDPDVSVIAHQEGFTTDKPHKIIAPYNIVVDGPDNFATRFLLNDAAFFAENHLSSEGLSGSKDRQTSSFRKKAGHVCTA